MINRDNNSIDHCIKSRFCTPYWIEFQKLTVYPAIIQKLSRIVSSNLMNQWESCLISDTDVKNMIHPGLKSTFLPYAMIDSFFNCFPTDQEINWNVGSDCKNCWLKISSCNPRFQIAQGLPAFDW